MMTTRWNWIGLAAIGAAITCFIAPVGAEDAKESPAVDAELLEDLGADLFDEQGAEETPAAADRAIDDQLTRELVQPEGEDVGAGQGARAQEDWLRQVTERMRAAESVLKTRDASGRASSAQQEAVSQLDAVIARLQKQCEKCGGQCNSPPSPSNKPPKPSAKPGAKPGATTAQLTGAVAPADQTVIGSLVKDLWGRLPDRQREELLQPLGEEFLPEYAAEIEDYFRVLAEPANDAETPR